MTSSQPPVLAERDPPAVPASPENEAVIAEQIAYVQRRLSEPAAADAKRRARILELEASLAESKDQVQALAESLEGARSERTFLQGKLSKLETKLVNGELAQESLKKMIQVELHQSALTYAQECASVDQNNRPKV